MKVLKQALAAAIGLSGVYLTVPAEAAPVFGIGRNDIFFQNFENAYRPTGACTAATCFASAGVTTAPAGYQLVVPTGALGPGTGGGLASGDLLIGVFNVQNIDLDGSTIWNFDNTPAGGIDTFTGYFVQQVSFVDSPPDALDPLNLSANHIQLMQAAADPFGILGAGEMFRLFVDDSIGGGGPGTPFESNGPTVLVNDIMNATDGTFWGAFGTGAVTAIGVTPDADGFAYTHADDATLATFTGETELAMNFVGGIPAGIPGGIVQGNDINEGELGDCPPGSTVPCVFTDVVGRSELEANPGSFLFGGVSPWIFRSNDPVTLVTTSVPEPTTVALLGIGLLGLGGIRRVIRRV